MSVNYSKCSEVIHKSINNTSLKSTHNHTNINITQQRKFLNHFVKIKKTNLITNRCIKDHSSSISKFSLSQVNKIWSTCQSKLPRNIFNFTTRYINSSLPTRKNLAEWGISTSSESSFCLHHETLLHVIAGCSWYLNRFTWRHDLILNFTVNNIHTKLSKRFC